LARTTFKDNLGPTTVKCPALRLDSIELCDLLSRELDKANVILDEWDFARTRDKQSGTSQSDASDASSATTRLRRTVQ